MELSQKNPASESHVMYKAEKKSEGGETKEGDAEKKEGSKSETKSTFEKDE